MKTLFVNFNVLYFLIGYTCVTMVIKIFSFLVFRRLIKEADNMAATQNRCFKAMMAKYEAYYEMNIDVYNVETFVDSYLNRFRFWGLSITIWEFFGTYLLVELIILSALLCLMAGYLGMTGRWFYITGCVVLILFIIQGGAELLLDTHRSYCTLREKLINFISYTFLLKLKKKHPRKEKKEPRYFKPVERQVSEHSVLSQITGKNEEDKRKAPEETDLSENEDLKELIKSLDQKDDASEEMERPRIFDEFLSDYL